MSVQLSWYIENRLIYGYGTGINAPRDLCQMNNKLLAMLDSSDYPGLIHSLIDLRDLNGRSAFVPPGVSTPIRCIRVQAGKSSLVGTIQRVAPPSSPSQTEPRCAFASSPQSKRVWPSCNPSIRVCLTSNHSRSGSSTRSNRLKPGSLPQSVLD